MAINKGKLFEERFKQDFIESFPNGTIDRIYDVVSGYKAISNISDFIGYNCPNIFYLECKSHKGASIPFVNITQYDKLKRKVGIPGVRAGIILWLREKDVIYYIPISTITKMKQEGKKSVGVQAYKDGYNIKLIPTRKLKTFLKGDYSVLSSLEEGE